MANKYSISEFVGNVYSLLMTKIFMKQARFIRRPIYIRGRKSISGARGLTTGRYCRFDLDGKKNTLYIGDGCEFGDNTHIVALDSVKIGNDVLIASKVYISDTNHGEYKGQMVTPPSVKPRERTLCTKPVEIGDNVWLGENVVVLPGVSIGPGCVIGANSVVNKSIAANSIAVGAPAKVVKVWSENTKTWERCNEDSSNKFTNWTR